MKILNVNNLLDVGQEVIPEDEFRGFETTIVAVINALAVRISELQKVVLHDVSNQPGFAGLCAAFRPGIDGETCDIIGSYDIGGDWFI